MDPTELTRRLGTTAAAITAALKPLTRLAKQMAALGKANDGPPLSDLRALLVETEATSLAGLGLETFQRELVDGLRAYIAHQEETLRFHFGRQLAETFRTVSVETRRLSEQPPEWRLGPLTAVVSFQDGTAVLHYARCPLEGGEVPLVPEAILRAWRQCKKELERSAAEPQVFFLALLGAYRAYLGRQGLRSEERVDLVDLYPEVAYALQPKRFFKDPRASFRPYSRAAFAYDLARLREARLLSDGANRLDFGSAVGGSTAQKDRVFWIEDASGSGQYYLNFRVVKVVRPAPPAFEARVSVPGEATQMDLPGGSTPPEASS